MIKEFKQLKTNELKTLKSIIKQHNKENYLVVSSLKDIMDNDIVVLNKENASIVRIEKSIFDEDGFNICFLFSSTLDITEFIRELESCYKNIYVYINRLIELSKYQNLFMTTSKKDNYKYFVEEYLCNKKENICRPLNHYVKESIPEFDISKIKYYDFSSDEFDIFIRKNYVSRDGKIIGWRGTRNSTLLGLYYTEYEGLRHDCRFLVGAIPNIDKETIAGVIKYNPKREIIKSYISTYLAYVETNYFYQQKGVFKDMVNHFLEIIPNQLLTISHESHMGEIVGTQRRIIESAKEKGVLFDVLPHHGNILTEYLKSKELIK